MSKLKIVAISDIHGELIKITEPADIMILAGDISPTNIQFNAPQMKTWLETEFIYWIKELPVKKVFYIAGNHDSYFQGLSDTKIYMLQLLSDHKLKYLLNDTAVYKDEEGVEWSIFGTPYCHIFGSWPFMREDSYMTEAFKEIPDVVDVVISHDPPYNIGMVDMILENPRHRHNEDKHIGNKPLRERLEQISFQYNFCGHIHSGQHEPVDFNVGKVINVSTLNENYDVWYSPYYCEIEK